MVIIKSIKELNGKVGKSFSHANRGLLFEELITSINHIYRRQKLGFIMKQYTPFMPYWDSAAGHMGKTFVRKQKDSDIAPDYLGVYQNIPLMFEAKHIKTSTFSFSLVQPHQYSYLKEFRSMGYMAFLFISFNNERFYILPEEVYSAMENHGLSMKIMRENKSGKPHEGRYVYKVGFSEIECKLPKYYSFKEEDINEFFKVSIIKHSDGYNYLDYMLEAKRIFGV